MLPEEHQVHGAFFGLWLCPDIPGLVWLGIVAVVFAVTLAKEANAQSRGVYPLGMSAANSGVTPEPGFTYSNQLLFYSRDEVKDQNGNTVSITGSNSVLMDMNSLIWVSTKEFLGGARFSAFATLPFAKNDLTSDIHGHISAGSGLRSASSTGSLPPPDVLPREPTIMSALDTGRMLSRLARRSTCKTTQR